MKSLHYTFLRCAVLAKLSIEYFHILNEFIERQNRTVLRGGKLICFIKHQ